MNIADDKFLHARVTQRKDFASDLWMIRVQANGEFKFAPGQYATLGVQRPEKRSERPYSIVVPLRKRNRILLRTGSAR